MTLKELIELNDLENSKISQLVINDRNKVNIYYGYFNGLDDINEYVLFKKGVNLESKNALSWSIDEYIDYDYDYYDNYIELGREIVLVVNIDCDEAEVNID